MAGDGELADLVRGSWWWDRRAVGGWRRRDHIWGGLQRLGSWGGWWPAASMAMVSHFRKVVRSSRGRAWELKGQGLPPNRLM